MAFTHILVPTDFSDPAGHALRCATEEAILHKAKVTLLHVLPAHAATDVYYVSGGPESGPRQGYDPIAGGRLAGMPLSEPTVVRSDPSEEALTRLHDLVPEAFHGAWEVTTAAGQPAEAIVRTAEERGADLIVMGTHGRTGLSHALLGSVAEKVVRLAPCPVLTVRHNSA
jgi:nucleotide-binding universal stress UspA family protein